MPVFGEPGGGKYILLSGITPPSGVDRQTMCLVLIELTVCQFYQVSKLTKSRLRKDLQIFRIK
jgi:hypothetical protein